MDTQRVTAADARRFRRKLFFTSVLVILFGFGLAGLRIAGHLVSPKMIPQMAVNELPGDTWIRIAAIFLVSGLGGLARSAFVRIPDKDPTPSGGTESNAYGLLPSASSGPPRVGLATARWLKAARPSDQRPAEPEQAPHDPFLSEPTEEESGPRGLVRWLLVIPLALLVLLCAFGTLGFLVAAATGASGSPTDLLIYAGACLLVGAGSVWGLRKLGRSRTEEPESAPEPASPAADAVERCWSSD